MKNIPFSLALRIVKICSDSINKDLRLGEYDESIIDSAIRRAIQIPRAIALEPKKESQKNDLNRPVYVSTYDPRVPNIKQIVKKHWRASCFLDKNFEKSFPEPPMIAFKRQRNLRSSLIRAKVYPNQPKKLRECTNV